MQKNDCHLILGGEIDHKRVRNHWKSNILYQFFINSLPARTFLTYILTMTFT
jgi:hypothetical protein